MIKPYDNKKTHTGFTLIEALVALVILSATLTAVWGWFSTVSNNTNRIEHALRMPLLFDEFIQYLQLENLETTRQGTVYIDDYEIRWQATINRSSNNEVYRRQPAWIVALFDIQANVTHNGEAITEFTTQQLAQWRDPNYIENPFGGPFGG